jgi:hypothetical protein
VQGKGGGLRWKVRVGVGAGVGVEGWSEVRVGPRVRVGARVGGRRTHEGEEEVELDEGGGKAEERLDTRAEARSDGEVDVVEGVVPG